MPLHNAIGDSKRFSYGLKDLLVLIVVYARCCCLLVLQLHVAAMFLVALTSVAATRPAHLSWEETATSLAPVSVMS